MSLQIFILGVLCSGNHHPYDLKKMFNQSNFDESSRISDGTLYYNFEVLFKKGFIEKIDVIHDEHRPSKTTYGITPKGKLELEQQIYASFKNFTSIKSVYSSTIFLKHADKQKLIYLIEDVLHNLREKIDKYDQLWDSIQNETPESVQMIQEYFHQQMHIDYQWLEKLLEYVKKM